MTRLRLHDPWVGWTCPHCSAEMVDPASIKATSCSNGHTAYLGKVHESPTGYSRRAYKTRGERTREQRKERTMHETYMTIITGAFDSSEL